MNKHLIYYFSVCLILFCGCEDVVDLNIENGEPILVVEGWIYNQPEPTLVKLTYTAPYFSNVANPPANNALVLLITNGSITDTLNENPSGSGVYKTNTTGQIGNTYNLYIKTSDGNEYLSLNEELVSVPIIDSIYYEFREKTLFDDEGYFVQIDTKEPLGLGDNYRWKFYVNDTLLNRPEDLNYADDEFVDGNDIIGLDVHFDPLKIGDRAKVEQLSTSRNAYSFFSLVQEQTLFVGSIFDFPASPIKGNMYNINDRKSPVLGFFGASAVESAEIEIQ